MVQAPVDPTTGLSKPLEATPAPTSAPVSPAPAEVKPVTPKNPAKVEPIVNRQKEIETNLSTGYNANPSLFTDRTAFDQAYNYQTKNPEERATLDSFYNSKQPTISSMYSAILNQQEVPEQTKLTPAYKIAQNRYTKANMYSGMTAAQVSSEMRNAKLIEGSQAFEDLKAINPKLVQDATNLRKVNGDKTNIWTNNPDGTKVNNLENTFASDFNDNFGEFIKSMYQIQTPEEIRAIIYTPDVKASEDKAKSIELDINKIDDSLAQVDRDVDKELAGSGATGSRIAMEKASRRDTLNDQRASLERNYTTYANKANNLITQNTTVFQTQQTQKQAQNAAMMPFITDQYKTAQAKQQAQEALNDPATAIQSVMSEFAGMGITSQQSLQTKIADAQKFVANDGTLAGYVDKMRQDYMAKPQYKAMQEAEMNKYAPKATESWTKLDDTTLYNQTTGETKKVSASVANGYALKPTGNIVPVTLGDKTVYLDQSSSAGFENAITQANTAGSPIFFAKGYRDQVDTIKSMANKQGIAFNASNPAETAQKLRTAGHQVADPGKSNHETGMAIDVYADSSMKSGVTPAQEKILNANGWYSGNIPGDAGHFEYRGTQGTGTQGTQYTDSDIELLAELANMDASARNTALKAQ
jgi:hypothetical protein